jgi:hypothetical protein|tara:strand:- start:1272 stop:1514 length:243 start_codon:yes stop_codon:yes gene_type:complete
LDCSRCGEDAIESKVGTGAFFETSPGTFDETSIAESHAMLRKSAEAHHLRRSAQDKEHERDLDLDLEAERAVDALLLGDD